ncbi:MAG TPA: hypothetical protein VJY34_14260 [Roseiarcus sp.]|nr:hypothetical protein [Roseiarcus sp.]
MKSGNARPEVSGRAPAGFSLAERLEYGNFSVAEACLLKNRCKCGFYLDVKAGLVALEKIGKKSVIRGPVLQRYLKGSA